MPLEARLNTIDSACSTERLSASLLEMSGTGAPGRTATPSPTRPTSTRSAEILPAPANSSSAAGGAIFHHFRRFRNLARDVVGEIPRRARGDFRAERLEPLAQVGQAQHLDDVAVEPLDERRGRGRGHDDAVPGDRLEPRYARLGQ